MKKLKIGVLGCANIAGRMVITAIRASGVFELTAVASRTLGKAKKLAETFGCDAVEGYDNLLEREDIDAVYIPLPPGLHREWAVKALEKGKHCLVEKPIAHDYASAEEMVETARKNGCSLFENFMFVYHSQHRFIREKLESGEIGEIRCFRASFGFPPLAEGNFRYDKNLGGGVLLDAGVYPLKAAQLILGGDLTAESAYFKMDPGLGVDIYGGAFLSNRRGLFAQIAFGFDNFYQCSYEIWGSKGKITAERAFTAGPGFKPKVVIEKQDQCFEYLLPPDNHFVNILNEFSRSIVEKEYDRDVQFRQILNQARLVREVKANAHWN
ncbi:MAG: Gfo/Idh/MocA family oxidoreductase [bacterium]|nr:Gfo/Idh/MocA family oxidoreductase [bacterium]